MERHHQEWSLWLNLTQHGKTHQVQTRSDEIAPILTAMFTQSVNSGNLPEDWLTANITPILKKR